MAADSFAAHQIQRSCTLMLENFRWQDSDPGVVKLLSNVVTDYAFNILEKSKVYAELGEFSSFK